MIQNLFNYFCSLVSFILLFISDLELYSLILIFNPTPELIFLTLLFINSHIILIFNPTPELMSDPTACPSLRQFSCNPYVQILMLNSGLTLLPTLLFNSSPITLIFNPTSQLSPVNNPSPKSF